METLPFAADDFVKTYWWDLIKGSLLVAAMTHFADYVAKHFGIEHAAAMHPGSGDAEVWPIREQRPLFSLLGDPQATIGVTLHESFLMSPNKTVSGIRFPAEHDFRTCQLCHRAVCPNRGAPFDKKLWDSVQADAHA
jgi:hypothetical protein